MKTHNDKIHLILFFTKGSSLQSWHSSGILEREVALYLQLAQHGFEVSFVTYGDRQDLKFSSDIPGITILCNRWGLPIWLYSLLLPFLHAGHLKSGDIYKSNQMNGADVVLEAARMWNKQFIVRCGFMWSDLARQSKYHDFDEAYNIEAKVFNGSSHVVVTTNRMKDYVIENHRISKNKISVIPNYVLTDLFTPSKQAPTKNKICFIGRINEEKNPLSLVRACAHTGVSLVIIGEGPLKEQVRSLAIELGVDLTLLGSVPHTQIPSVLSSSELFVLLSPKEGHPKTLLEAMACGVPVIGADSPGIRDLIEHGVTGWLTEATPESVRAAIAHLLNQPQLRKQIGETAREFVINNFSLDRILDLEIALYRRLMDASGS